MSRAKLPSPYKFLLTVELDDGSTKEFKGRAHGFDNYQNLNIHLTGILPGMAIDRVKVPTRKQPKSKLAKPRQVVTEAILKEQEDW